MACHFITSNMLNAYEIRTNIFAQTFIIEFFLQITAKTESNINSQNKLGLFKNNYSN